MGEYKLKIKNKPDTFLLLDGKGYNAIKKDPYLNSLNFMENLSVYSTGHAVFSKSISLEKNKPVNTVIYPSRWLANKFIKKPKDSKKVFLNFKNGNKLDCRLENLEYVTFHQIQRIGIKPKSRSGYRGVVKTPKKGFEAYIYKNHVRIHIGFYETAEEAAKAYNKKSIEFFGETKSLNEV